MIADGETGSVFDKGSIDSLAQRLGELIAAPEQRAKLGRQGREWVCAHRTWTSMTRRFEGHYLQLVKPTT
jgi:glycosyltransferase involved in cell wall biosynthesis